MSVLRELKRRVRRYEPCLPRPGKEPPAGPGWNSRNQTRWLSHPGRARRRPCAARNSERLRPSRTFPAGRSCGRRVAGALLYRRQRSNRLRRQRPLRVRPAPLSPPGRRCDALRLRPARTGWRGPAPEPIEVRKRTLEGLLRREHRGIAFNRHFDGDGAIIYKHACALGCEGIVSKRLGSPYRPGRQDCWIKVKNPAAPAMRREAEEDWG